MGATALLSMTELVVEPGQAAAVPVTIRNTGSVVDQFAIDILGTAMSWATCEPASVNLLPGDSVTVNVVFAPPRSAAVPAASVPFGVRVTSREDPDGSVIEEGAVIVAPFTDVTAQVIPAKVEAARRGRYEIAVDNHGNHPVLIRLHPADQEGDLEFTLDRPEFELGPGMATFARLRARPRRLFLRGQPRRHQFRAFVSVDDAEPFTADAAFVQRQLLPKWLIPVLAAILAFLALLAVLYYGVLRPQIRSDARAEVTAQTNHLAAAASSAQAQASSAAQAVTSVQKAVQGGGGGKPPAAVPPPTAAPGVPVPAGSSPAQTQFRIPADTTVTAGNPKAFSVFPMPKLPPNSTLLVTDIFIQNPYGDSGTLLIQRGDANDILLIEGMGNFRDDDKHLVQPMEFTTDQPLEVTVNCQAVGATSPNDGKCHPTVTFVGQVITPNPGR